MNWHWISRSGSYLTKAEKAVLHAIIGRCDETGEAYPGMVRLCRESGYRSDRTVYDAICGLVRKGCLTVTVRPGRSNLYRVHEPDTTARQMDLFAPLSKIAGHPRKKRKPPPSRIAGGSRNRSGTKPKLKPKEEAGKEAVPAAAPHDPLMGHRQGHTLGHPSFDRKISECIRVAFEEFEQAKGRKPVWETKDFAAVAGLVKRHDWVTVAEFSRRFGNFIRSTEEFTQRQGGSLAYFCSKFDQFADGPLQEVESRKSKSENREAHVGSGPTAGGFDPEYIRTFRERAGLRSLDPETLN